jgi:surfeit locus 1 family protein
MVDAFGRGTGSSVVLSAGASVDALPRYQHVRADGRFLPGRQILLDNMPSSSGKPGFRVLTPFERAGGGRLLLVDRGWVPLGASRAEFPDVTVDAQPRSVAGRLDELPAPGVRVGEAGVAGDTRWPRVLNFPRREDVERVLGAAVEPRIVLLDAGLPDGYERAWRPALRFGPERHLGYAVQWFALALATLVVFLALSLRTVHAKPGAAGQDSQP